MHSKDMVEAPLKSIDNNSELCEKTTLYLPTWRSYTIKYLRHMRGTGLQNLKENVSCGNPNPKPYSPY